jgi:hypothetical protein
MLFSKPKAVPGQPEHRFLSKSIASFVTAWNQRAFCLSEKLLARAFRKIREFYGSVWGQAPFEDFETYPF